MGLHRARGVALMVVALASVVSLGNVSPATASSGAAPSVSLRQSGSGTVTVSGRTAGAAPRVSFYRATRSGWALVKRVRAHHHRYSARLAVAPSARSFKVTADSRSRTFVVRGATATAAATAPATAAAPASKPSQSDACGVRPLKADGSAWSCTFADDFNGTTLDRTKWIPQTIFATGSADAYACYRDDPSNVSVSNGALNLTLLKLAAPAPCGLSSLGPTVYQSGMVSTWHLFSQQYGRFEARIKNTATTSPGLHEAFWMWPDDRYGDASNWPTTGEIDVSETYSVWPTVSQPFLHYSADSGGQQLGLNTAWDCTAQRGQWNTYTLEWTAQRITIFVNGKTCLVNTSGDAAFQKRYIIDLTQSLGGAPDAPVADTPFPATMQVDYVRVWK